MSEQEERRLHQAALEDKIAHLEEKVDKLSENIQGLIEAWQTAKGISSFVKWVGSLAGGGAILYALLHGGVPK